MNELKARKCIRKINPNCLRNYYVTDEESINHFLRDLQNTFLTRGYMERIYDAQATAYFKGVVNVRLEPVLTDRLHIGEGDFGLRVLVRNPEGNVAEKIIVECSLYEFELPIKPIKIYKSKNTIAYGFVTDHQETQESPSLWEVHKAPQDREKVLVLV